MNVDLPNGCNIINSATSFYNYTNNNRTRALYYIYEGKAFKANEITNNYGFDYTGTCLSTGSLIYKPELKIYFPVIAFIIICGAFLLAYKIVLWRFIK